MFPFPSQDQHGRFAFLSRRPRRLLAVLAPLAAATVLLAPSAASADTSSTLTVVGTSDVSDSGLIQNVIAPAFKAQFPQFSFKYVGSATGVAINSAEQGTGGPSALIVHAASLENQFVAGGFSVNNQFGNAIFTNDFVLAGPTGDPAGAAANGLHNIARAYADIAAAGVAGTATYLSRGGNTTAPGTTVEEHALWALMDQAGLTPAGVALCKVSAADGGGESPINPADPAAGGNCPASTSGTVDSSNAPSWYIINNVNQGLSVVGANACTIGGAVHNGCYVLTDRGTFDYLAGGNSPAAGTTGIPNLAIVSRDNAASSPGGADALINYFHAYIINPSAPNETVNLPAAQAFVSMLTSPAIQGQIAQYLNTTTDPAGAPFKPSASPTITATGLPSTVGAGQSVTVSGQVSNAQPGFAQIANQPVAVNQLVGGLPVRVATGTTNATGGYSVTFTPVSSGSYDVSTGAISLIENASLSPAYGDILSPASTNATAVDVGGAATIVKTTTTAGSVQVSGTVGPAAPDSNATVTLMARPRSSTGGFTTIGSHSLTQGQATFAVSGALKGGNWTIETQYSDPGSFTAATSATRNVTVPARSVKVTFGKLKLSKGSLTLTGKLGQAPTARKGATVTLLALRTSKVSVKPGKGSEKGGKKKTKHVVVSADAKGATFRAVAKATVKKGKIRYTIKHTFKRGFRYALQLKYSSKGQPTTHSAKFKYIDVH